MDRFRNWLYKTMYGLYGQDSFGRFLFFLSIALWVISIFTNYLVSIAALLVMGVEYFRIFSKNIAARRRENDRYMRLTAGIRRFFASKKAELAQGKKYKIFKCPECKQKLRLPRGRGKIEIRCRKCGNQFIRRT